MIIAGNWKMNPGWDEASHLIEGLKGVKTPNAVVSVVFPPFTMLDHIRRSLGGGLLKLGGQDCHHASHGAFTGDISASMLVEAGCEWVLVGHSERRTHHGETNQQVTAKTTAALKAGLKTIICVGETEQQREAGKAINTVTDMVISSIPPDADPALVAVAYEPVWAIGTGKVASLADIEEIHHHIKNALKGFGAAMGSCPVLYGGSVKAENAAEILALSDVNGVLVGGASLKADEFIRIIQAAMS